ncbi:hypothetical protein TIFTF001_034980 [Ficus carica]|uniref:Protein kinase domain-containing protein n=1 Tax=Ficus carica TaxID=3494 RepID=A0AA88J9B8_FICCA|nr:hypothetical protein TIFTF001_034980 [Ficus carica]
MVWKKRIKGKQEERKASNIEPKTRLGPWRFTLIELSDATNNFSHKLGEGGFGGVYKGVLSDSNAEVAVKRISKESKQGRKEYIADVRISCWLSSSVGAMRWTNCLSSMNSCQMEALIPIYLAANSDYHGACGTK